MGTKSYDEVWARIKESPFGNMFYLEVERLASRGVNIAGEIFDKYTPSLGPRYVGVDPELHAQIYELLGCAAKIRALISPRRQKTGRQSRMQI